MDLTQAFTEPYACGLALFRSQLTSVSIKITVYQQRNAEIKDQVAGVEICRLRSSPTALIGRVLAIQREGSAGGS